MAKKKIDKFLNNNENLPINVEIKYTTEDLEELRKCKEDVVYFAENYFYIRVLDKGRQKITLHNCQKRLIRKIVANRRTISCASRQTGKCLDLNTPIPTPDGWTTMGELKDGDMVLDENGNPAKVLKAHEIKYNLDCYELTFSTGEKIIADKDHKWMTQSFLERHGNKNKESKKTTEEIYNSLKANNASNHKIPTPINGLQLDNKELLINPYLYGLWLGDRFNHNYGITGEVTDLDEIKKYIKEHDILKTDNISLIDIKDRPTCKRMHFIGKNAYGQSLSSIFSENLKLDKNIKKEYLRASQEQRLELLRGLMDSDGSAGKKCYFYNTDEAMINSVKELLSSLSIVYSYHTKPNSYKGKPGKLLHCLVFNTHHRVFNLSRKIKNQKVSKSKKTSSIYIVDVKPVESRPVKCITVDSPKGMFLCGKTMVPTSNTTVMTIVCLWYALFNPDYEIGVLANKEVQAKEILDRIKLAYEEIPNFIKAGVWTFSQEIIKLTNGSKIYVSTTSGTSLRGKSVNLVFVDEFAFVPPEIADAFFKSVIPVLSSGENTKLVICSTPQGLLNKFYKLYSDAEAGRSNWAWDKMYWHELPNRDDKWKQDQLEAIGYDMDLWNQEYDIMFLEDGTAAINLQLLEKFKNGCGPVEFSYDNGDYKIWVEPKEDRIYSIGVDAAEGVGQDYSVAQILDVTDPTEIIQCAMFASNRLQPYVFAEKLNQIARSWGRPFMCIESNKEGSQVIDALYQVHNYDNIITVTMKNDVRGAYQKMGIFCHGNSKSKGITHMKYMIETRQAVKFNDLQTVKEFETFVRTGQKKWEARKGFHDDRIMALLWGLYLLERETAEKYLNVLDYDDAGLPSRISDPNQEIANQSFYDQGKNVSYARTGGIPPPMLFQKGREIFNYSAANSYADSGWAFIQ